MSQRGETRSRRLKLHSLQMNVNKGNVERHLPIAIKKSVRISLCKTGCCTDLNRKKVNDGVATMCTLRIC